MNITALRHILEISNNKSINKTAEKIFVSQSTLSREIKSIEDEIGIIIFKRTSHGIELTLEGETFVKRVENLISEIDNFESEYIIDSVQNEDYTELMVASSKSTPFLNLFTDFYIKHCAEKKYQNIAIYETNRDNIYALVKQGTCKIGVFNCFYHEKSDVLNKCNILGLEFKQLHLSPLCVQVRKEHPLSKEKSITMDMLNDFPRIHFIEDELTDFQRYSKILEYNRNSVEKRIVVNERASVRQIVEYTNAYYLGSDLNCNITTFEPEALCLPVKETNLQILTACIYNKKKSYSEAEKRFIEILPHALG